MPFLSLILTTVCAVMMLGWPALAVAHGGGLDASGCHHNRRTGEYHCHRAPVRTAPSTPADKPTDANGTDRASCGRKRHCTEMASCREAMHYFRDCGVTRLDGDNDGVPCEKLCGQH